MILIQHECGGDDKQLHPTEKKLLWMMGAFIGCIVLIILGLAGIGVWHLFHRGSA